MGLHRWFFSFSRWNNHRQECIVVVVAKHVLLFFWSNRDGFFHVIVVQMNHFGLLRSCSCWKRSIVFLFGRQRTGFDKTSLWLRRSTQIQIHQSIVVIVVPKQIFSFRFLRSEQCIHLSSIIGGWCRWWALLSF